MQTFSARASQTLVLLLCSIALSACSTMENTLNQAMPIIREVEPLPPMPLATLCIATNEQVKKHAFDEELGSLIQTFDIRTPRKEGAFRGECRFWLRYNITYAGRMPEYTQTMNIWVYDNRAQIGSIRYDASQATARPDRLGFSRDKLRPLLEQLFAQVNK